MYQGKHKAIVTDINDPDKMGRIRVQCPKLLGDYESSWCLPCVPFSGLCMIPNIGDMVWIEFEDNDPDLPIWVGSFWGQSETPLDDQYNKAEEIKILKVGDMTIELDSSDTGGIKIYNKSKAGITIKNDNSIEICGSSINFKQV